MRNSTADYPTLKSPRSEIATPARVRSGGRSAENRHTGGVRLVEDLTGRERDQMYSLMNRYFCEVTRKRFEEDLAEKTWACVIHDARSGRLVGFSTLMRLEAVMNGQTVLALFSGDTIVAREHWGQQVLHRVMGQHMLDLAQRSAPTPTFWLLISSGYKTYRFLPLFCREFFPRYDAPTPSGMRLLIDELAGNKFGPEYHREAGVVRFSEPAPLRPGVAEIDQIRLRDPHVAFFAHVNPGHSMGDELVCIAELAPSNLTSAGRRFLRNTKSPTRMLNTYEELHYFPG